MPAVQAYSTKTKRGAPPRPQHLPVSPAINAIHPQRCACRRCDPVRIMNARAVVRSAIFGALPVLALFWMLWAETPR